MALSVNTNVASINAQRNLSKSSDALGTSMQRLSSGMKINSAKDDAAGLQIANRLSSQINGLGVAQRNANDGISMSQTAEGAMTESSNILQRMRDLALQSANGSNDADARAALQKEVGALQQELTRIAETTKFGGTSLLDGSFGTKQFQVGSNANETINVSLRDVSADAIGANEIKGGATSTVSALGDVQTVALSANVATSAQTVNINGVDIEVAASSGAAAIADTINSSGAGVNAQAKLTTTIAGIDASSSSTIEIKKGGTAVDKYDLGTFGGDMARLAKDMQEDGYDAVYDEAAGSISFTATDIDGIDVTGAGDTSGFTIGAQAVASTAGSLSVSAELNLSSADKIGISGTKVDEIFGSDASTIDSTGGSSALTSVETIDISGATSAGAQNAINTIDAALAQIDAQRADLGAVQNRFGFTIANLANVSENVSASKSRIEDTDYAAETAKLTKNQIMQQAGTTILAQSNQLPQAALSLLG
ncbi:flagellin [Pseudoalteromonas issachenkonii]|jgi:flagellin|uniref:Flagellin n=3 Tax=Pseudoalteromonas TaxID=53246 RepID=A0AB39AMX0_9GAMM|nr:MULTISPECIES: flagellin [Pseudoalteromonas]MAY59408.1 flagellin [Pseudoalteromonas sp.]ALQ55500.1 flagellin [Pseudoalteromonas issachenkonii]ATC91353.1 flagellin [Pseudoalteromonas issachenkonii]KYL37096.1 flagellin [Pseudoalteromonas spiralis]MDN3404620.1 flagellin [Pseudoalteromonas sp. APC 3218]|tara:strand:+ start:22569 stop:24011 length:1443 start_codon:yes stop_codon:yes gene_type:complete